MRLLSLIPAGLLFFMPGCAETPPPAPAAPRVVAAPPPRPAPVAAALGADWRDWPLTAGDWRYAGGAATFATGSTPLLSFRCEGGAIALTRAGSAATTTVRASTLARTLPMAAGEGGSVARLPARDPLFDAIGFSRGRFVIETPGAAPLVAPAYPEILRVIEDCRR